MQFSSVIGKSAGPSLPEEARAPAAALPRARVRRRGGDGEARGGGGVLAARRRRGPRQARGDAAWTTRATRLPRPRACRVPSGGPAAVTAATGTEARRARVDAPPLRNQRIESASGAATVRVSRRARDDEARHPRRAPSGTQGGSMAILPPHWIARGSTGGLTGRVTAADDATTNACCHRILFSRRGKGDLRLVLATAGARRRQSDSRPKPRRAAVLTSGSLSSSLDLKSFITRPRPDDLTRRTSRKTR